MLLQALITIVFICFGDGFRTLINFAVIVSWLAFFLTVSPFPRFHPQPWLDSQSRENKVLGLVVLRIKEPSLERYGFCHVTMIQSSRRLPLARTKPGSPLL